MKKLLLISLSILGLAGCSTKVAEYSLLSNRNIDITHSQNFSRGSQVQALDTAMIVTIFELGTPDVGVALKKAIDLDKCTVALTDVTVTDTSFWAGVLGIHQIDVNGRQVFDTALSGCENRR